MSTSPTTEEPKFCINCKHATQLFDGGEWRCKAIQLPVDLVTSIQAPAFCSQQRQIHYSSPCGPDAKLFEPKTT